jgi:guanyl-specific ribonuclease Sa
VNKRTLAIILVILAVFAAVWLSDTLSSQSEAGLPGAQGENTLVLIENQDAGEAAAQPAAQTTAQAQATDEPQAAQAAIDKAGSYTSKEDVSLYLYIYGQLPQNFITKTEARALGWSGGGLDDYAYGKCIGGDRFGNNEGLLPEAAGRKYFECDIGTLHKDSRGSRRIVFSNDGLIYYTEDHYESFDLLYGEP